MWRRVSKWENITKNAVILINIWKQKKKRKNSQEWNVENFSGEAQFPTDINFQITDTSNK